MRLLKSVTNMDSQNALPMRVLYIFKEDVQDESETTERVQSMVGGSNEKKSPQVY